MSRGYDPMAASEYSQKQLQMEQTSESSLLECTLEESCLTGSCLFEGGDRSLRASVICFTARWKGADLSKKYATEGNGRLLLKASGPDFIKPSNI